MKATANGSALDAEGFVLAGGQSARMGTDKALVDFAGRPLIEHALSQLAGLGLTAKIAGARRPLDTYSPVIPDEGRGPLDGICAALEVCAAPLAVFVSVDMPLVPPSAIAALLQAARVAAPGGVLFTLNGFIQTFPAVIDRVLLPALVAELSSGHSGCLRATRSAAQALNRPLRLLPVEHLAQADICRDAAYLHPLFWFLNLNTPGEIFAASQLLHGKARVI